MKSIFSALSRSPGYRELSGALASGAVPAVATGLSGVHKCAAIAALCRDSGRRALILAADEAESQRFFEDLSSLGLSPVQFPLRDMNFRDTAVSSREYERLRLEALSRLENGSCGCVIACMDAALQFTMGPKDLKRRLFSLKAGQSLSIESLLEAVVGWG